VTAAYDVATGRVALPDVPGVSPACVWAVAMEMACATNQTTKKSWLSVATLVARTGYGERQVQRARAALVTDKVFVPLDTNHKSQAFTPGWRVSARKKIPKLPEGLTGAARMVMTLWLNGVRTTKMLARKTGLALRTVQKYVARLGVPTVTRREASPLSPEQRTPSLREVRGPSELVPSSKGGRRSRRQRLNDRWRKVMGNYPVLGDDPRYTPGEDLVRGAEKAARQQRINNRRAKPKDEWTVKDVVDEFRQRYDLKYPMHSPDELGEYRQMVQILGKLKNDGVTVQHMITCIDEFYTRMLDRGKAQYPAWRKYLWLVRDTRPRDEGQFILEQEAKHREHVRQTPAQPIVRTSRTQEVVQQELEELEERLAKALENEELYLANNGQNAIATLKWRVDDLRLELEEGA
jgi:hypothetical protein